MPVAQSHPGKKPVDAPAPRIVAERGDQQRDYRLPPIAGDRGEAPAALQQAMDGPATGGPPAPGHGVVICERRRGCRDQDMPGQDAPFAREAGDRDRFEQVLSIPVIIGAIDAHRLVIHGNADRPAQRDRLAAGQGRQFAVHLVDQRIGPGRPCQDAEPHQQQEADTEEQDDLPHRSHRLEIEIDEIGPVERAEDDDERRKRIIEAP